jgi:hypothetical protein
VSEKGPARAAAALAATAVLVAAIVAYEAGRRGRTPDPERPGPDTAPAGVAGAPASASDPTPLAESAQPAGAEDSAVFEKPVATDERPGAAGAPDRPEPAATEAPAAAEPPPASAPRGERRDASRCIRLDATPTWVEAHRAAGPIVQLTVRAQNDCALAFEGRQVSFRISAASPDGFVLAQTVGQFGNDLPPYGTAQTTVDLLCDATRVARYRVELL